VVGSASSHRNQDVPEVQQVGKCKMDSHADTCCLGANFIPIYFTSKVCNVAPFLSDLPNQEGIPICSGATAFEMPMDVHMSSSSVRHSGLAIR